MNFQYLRQKSWVRKVSVFLISASLSSVRQHLYSPVCFSIPCVMILQARWSLETPTVNSSVQFSLVTQSCPTLCDPMNCSTPGLSVHHQLSEFTQTHIHRVGCHPVISSSVIPFSSCPQSRPASESFPVSQLFASGWSFSFSISPSKEYPGLISFRMDWLDLLAI